MQLSHTRPVVSARFDEPNLVSSAGLVPVMSLARRAGLRELADEWLSVPTDKGANAGLKLSSLVAGMAAGADSIDDMALLRHGGIGKVFDAAYAPSTLGSFLRKFSFGHVRQADAVASRFLVNLAQNTELLGAVCDVGTVMVDIDDTIIEVHGHKKQGAAFGYSGVRGLNALLATVSTDQVAPVIAAQRLRKGSAGSPRGAAARASPSPTSIHSAVRPTPRVIVDRGPHPALGPLACEPTLSGSRRRRGCSSRARRAGLCSPCTATTRAVTPPRIARTVSSRARGRSGHAIFIDRYVSQPIHSLQRRCAMTGDFGELAARARTGWNDDERRLYDAASRMFQGEVDAASRLGAQLRSARVARNLSQSELAAITGVQQSEISRIERGLGNPTTHTMSRLAAGAAMRLNLEPSPTPSVAGLGPSRALTHSS